MQNDTHLINDNKKNHTAKVGISSWKIWMKCFHKASKMLTDNPTLGTALFFNKSAKAFAW